MITLLTFSLLWKREKTSSSQMSQNFTSQAIQLLSGRLLSNDNVKAALHGANETAIQSLSPLTTLAIFIFKYLKRERNATVSCYI